MQFLLYLVWYLKRSTTHANVYWGVLTAQMLIYILSTLILQESIIRIVSTFKLVRTWECEECKLGVLRLLKTICGYLLNELFVSFNVFPSVRFILKYLFSRCLMDTSPVDMWVGTDSLKVTEAEANFGLLDPAVSHNQRSRTLMKLTTTICVLCKTFSQLY